MGNPLLWTASTAITALRNTVGDPSGATVTRWTAAEMDAYFNRAMLQVTLDCELTFRTSWTADIVASQREYAAPPSFFKAESVQWVKAANTDIVQLKYLPRQVYRDLILHDESTTGSPWGYYLWKKMGADPTTYQTASLFLHPTPNAAASAVTSGISPNLRIYGYKYPDTIDSTSAGTKVVELEPVHVETALMWAAYLILSDEGDPRASEKLATYQLLVEKNKGSLAREDVSTTSRLRPKGHRRSAEDLPQGAPWIRWG